MDMKQIGQRIRNAREAANITQEGLALAIGCTTKHIGAIERGIKTPGWIPLSPLPTPWAPPQTTCFRIFWNSLRSCWPGRWLPSWASFPRICRFGVLKGLRAFAGRG